MKSLFKVLLAFSLLLSMTACTAESKPDKFEAGVYQSTQTGHHGEIVVETTFTNERIEQVKIVKNGDTMMISEPAAEAICANVVKYQTSEVDAVSGATLSSNAMMRGISDCIKQAEGIEDATMPEAEHLTKEGERYDIVIVGAGISGITAALAAATEEDNQTESDLKILIIEEMPFIGGSFIVSGAGIFNPYGTEDHKNGKLDIIDEDTFIEYLNYRNEGDPLKLTSEALQRKVYQGIDPAEKMLSNAGMPFTWYDIIECEVMDVTFPKSSNHALADVFAFTKTYSSLEEEFVAQHGYGSTADICGKYLETALQSKSNITVKLNTEATHLLMENDNVIGVQVKETDYLKNTVTEYDIKSDKVILATGSPNLNSEIIAKYDPSFATAYPFSEAGQNGDGIVMMQEAGLNPVIQGYGGMCYNGTSLQYGMEDGLALYTLGYPVLNTDGNRYYDESITAPYDTGKYTRAQKDNTAYIIFDKNCEFLNGNYLGSYAGVLLEGENLYDYMVRKGFAVKADTLEELAIQIGLEPEKLETVISDWNKAVDGELSDDLMAAPEYAFSVKEGPYYAEKIHALSIESYISLRTLEGSTQLIREDGTAINNLYGCGTLIVSNLFYGPYFNYGGGLTTSLSSGYIAGKEVSDLLK